MSYLRVIPRDLFNEANLLKCLGKFWIETERFQPKRVTIEHDGEPFDIWQNPDDGTLVVRNIAITINGRPYCALRPLNSRRSWPLYLETGDGERIDVFQDDGDGVLTEELLATIQKEPPKTLLGRTDFDQIAREAMDPNTPPIEVSEQEYWDMLEVLPPIYVPGGFMVSEPVTDTRKGTAYAHYAQRGEKFFARYAVHGRKETYIPSAVLHGGAK